MVLCTIRGIICAIGELEKGVYAQLVEWMWSGCGGESLKVVP
jgi:hypothetical protein